MPTGSVAIPARSAAAYESWRPPIVGVALLVPVGTHCLAVVDLHGNAHAARR